MSDDDTGEVPEQEQGDLEDHHVPADLIELYEVLEWNGEIEGPPRTAPGPLGSAPSGITHFVSRAAWGARPPKRNPPSIVRSAEGNTLHYEGPHMGAFSHSSCATKVRAIQRYHMDNKGWNDVAYNSIECPHGYVYECRWYGARSGANGTDTGNNRSYAHCALIGQGDPATADLKQALTEVRRHFESRGSGTKKWSHRDWKATACPGDPLHDWRIKTGWNATGSASPTPEPEPAKDGTVYVELILAAYRAKRGADYDPRIKDAGGWTHWMDRGLQATPAQQRALVDECKSLLNAYG